MLRIAMIKDGVVLNIADWDGVSPWSPSGFTLVDITHKTDTTGAPVNVGCTTDGVTFVAPPMPAVDESTA